MDRIVEDRDVNGESGEGLELLAFRCFRRALGDPPLSLPVDDLIEIPSVLEETRDKRPDYGSLFRRILELPVDFRLVCADTLAGPR